MAALGLGRSACPHLLSLVEMEALYARQAVRCACVSRSFCHGRDFGDLPLVPSKLGGCLHPERGAHLTLPQIPLDPLPLPYALLGRSTAFVWRWHESLAKNQRRHLG